MNRLLSWLVVPGLAVGISACDKKEGVPLPKTGAEELKQQAREAVGAAQNACELSVFEALVRKTILGAAKRV